MKSMLKSIAMVIASFAMLSIMTQARATETNVVLNLEGNPTCNSLGANDMIIEIRDNDPQPGENIVTGDIFFEGMFVGEQRIVYYMNISGESVDKWEIDVPEEEVTPVNYTILKARGNAGAVVYHFGGKNAGATKDSVEVANGEITAVSFCYGLTGPTVPPVAVVIPECDEFSSGGGVDDLGGTEIGACPTATMGDPAQRVLISLDLLAKDFDVQSCTCNVPGGLPICDPEASVNEPGACMDTIGPGNGVNERVPVLIQAVENPDSYICYTIGGRRLCYGHF